MTVFAPGRNRLNLLVRSEIVRQQGQPRGWRQIRPCICRSALVKRQNKSRPESGGLAEIVFVSRPVEQVLCSRSMRKLAPLRAPNPQTLSCLCFIDSSSALLLPKTSEFKRFRGRLTSPVKIWRSSERSPPLNQTKDAKSSPHAGLARVQVLGVARHGSQPPWNPWMRGTGKSSFALCRSPENPLSLVKRISKSHPEQTKSPSLGGRRPQTVPPSGSACVAPTFPSGRATLFRRTAQHLVLVRGPASPPRPGNRRPSAGRPRHYGWRLPLALPCVSDSLPGCASQTGWQPKGFGRARNRHGRNAAPVVTPSSRRSSGFPQNVRRRHRHSHGTVKRVVCRNGQTAATTRPRCPYLPPNTGAATPART